MNNIKIKVVAAIIVIVLLDQLLKIYVKCTFPISGGFDMLGLSWAKIQFVENRGMALGLEFGGKIGKIILSLFRVFASVALVYFIFRSIKLNKSVFFIIGLTLIAGGAIGNNFDGMFYGIIFSESDFTHIATVFPPGGGYASIFEGKVVDMLYFPLIDTNFPLWIPFIGGQPFRFNNYIFNFADAAVTVGTIILLSSSIKKQTALEN